MSIWEGTRIMNVTRMAAGLALVAAFSGLPSGVGLADAAPLAPAPPSPVSQPDANGPLPGIPALKCWPYGRVGGGSAENGGGQPSYPPPCAWHQRLPG